MGVGRKKRKTFLLHGKKKHIMNTEGCNLQISELQDWGIGGQSFLKVNPLGIFKQGSK